jgi:hypothetical protein
MEIPALLRKLCVREIKEKVRVRKIIIPLHQFEIYVSLAEATIGEKYHPIKAIIKISCFK